MLIKHKDDFLSINGKQSVKLENGIIQFKNYSKQIPDPFKIYYDFECNLRGVESYEGSHTKKYQDPIPCSLGLKVVCVDDRFTKPIVVYSGENALRNLSKQFLRITSTAKKQWTNTLKKVWSWV